MIKKKPIFNTVANNIFKFFECTFFFFNFKHRIILHVKGYIRFIAFVLDNDFFPQKNHGILFNFHAVLECRLSMSKSMQLEPRDQSTSFLCVYNTNAWSGDRFLRRLRRHPLHGHVILFLVICHKHLQRSTSLYKNIGFWGLFRKTPFIPCNKVLFG